MLLEGLLDTGQEGVYGLLALGTGRFLGDMQKTDYGVSGSPPASRSSLAFTTAATYSLVAIRVSSRRVR